MIQAQTPSAEIAPLYQKSEDFRGTKANKEEFSLSNSRVIHSTALLKSFCSLADVKEKYKMKCRRKYLTLFTKVKTF